MILDHSRTSGGINLFYAGRTAADLGQQYYEDEQQFAESTFGQRATEVGVAAFGIHSLRNLNSPFTNYNKSFMQGMRPGLSYTSGAGVGYMLFGGDGLVEDSLQVGATSVAFNMAKKYKAPQVGKAYVAEVIDAFSQDRNFQGINIGKVNKIVKNKSSIIDYATDQKLTELKNNKNLMSNRIGIVPSVTATSIGRSQKQVRLLESEVLDIKNKKLGFFGSIKDQFTKNSRVNILSKQSEIINTVNKAMPTVRLGNSEIASRNIYTTDKSNMLKPINVQASRIKYGSTTSYKSRSPEEIKSLAKRFGKAETGFAPIEKIGNTRRALFGAGGLALLAGYGATKVASASFETFQKGLNIVQNSTRLDFGDGMAFNLGNATSERQRALQAMANSNMNARNFMGQEANFYF